MSAQKKTKLAKPPLPDNWGKPISGWEDKGAAPEITADALDVRNVKEKISIWLDQDLLDTIRNMAASTSEKYQPLVNRLLRKIVMGEGAVQSPESAIRIKRWLAANPGITHTTLMNLAVETFIASPRILKSIDPTKDEEAASQKTHRGGT